MVWKIDAKSDSPLELISIQTRAPRACEELKRLPEVRLYGAMEISPKQTLIVKVGHYSFPLGIEIDSSLPFSQERRECWPSHRTFSVLCGTEMAPVAKL
jgi:hypothetical protein